MPPAADRNSDYIGGSPGQVQGTWGNLQLSGVYYRHQIPWVWQIAAIADAVLKRLPQEERPVAIGRAGRWDRTQGGSGILNRQS
jgi:hypothetical protein